MSILMCADGQVGRVAVVSFSCISPSVLGRGDKSMVVTRGRCICHETKKQSVQLSPFIQRRLFVLLSGAGGVGGVGSWNLSALTAHMTKQT